MIYSFLALLVLALSPAWAGYQQLTRDNGNLFFSVDTIDIFRFNAQEMKLLVLDQGAGDIEDMLEQHGCVAGINGGYFAKGDSRPPLGIIRHEGRTVAGRLARGATFTVSGVLYDTGKSIRLERSKLISRPLSSIQEALQAGPFLVEHGRVIRGLNKTARAPRSFIATDGRGSWCIGSSSSLTLHELAEWLHGKSFASAVFTPSMALNLDGGGSCFFYTQSPSRFTPPSRVIRSFIGIAPRAASREASPQG